MKTFVAAALISLASVATAQLDNIPSCALNCFLTPLSSDGCPSLDDFKCHCQKSDSLISSVTPCVQKACSADEEAKVIEAVVGTCASAGVSISVPSATGGSSAAPSSAAPSSAAPSSAAPSSYSASVTETSTAEVPSSSVSGGPTASSNGTVTGTATPSASVFPGAAARVTQAAGVLGAAAIAFLAL